MIRIRRFNDAGVRRFGEFIDSFSGPEPQSLDALRALLRDATLTTEFSTAVNADEHAVFERRFDLAKYLHDRVPQLGSADPARDQGLWTWLAALWFDQLAPFANGKRKVGERAKWIKTEDRKRFRHLIAGPYLLYSAHQDDPESTLCVLSNPPHTPGEMYGQLGHKTAVFQCTAALGAATLMYYDRESRGLRRGAGSSTSGGVPRRFNAVIHQLDRTFDLHSLSDREFVDLLPKEFAKFKAHVQPTVVVQSQRSSVRPAAR